MSTGLSGLDHVIGEIEPTDFISIVGPPCAGKTTLLLDLAARIVIRYNKNVVFFSAHRPNVFIARKLELSGRVPTALPLGGAQRSGSDWHSAPPSVYLLDRTSTPAVEAIEFAHRLQRESPAACAGLIMDGYSTLPEPREGVQIVQGAAYLPSDPWAHTLLTGNQLNQWWHLAFAMELPIICGLTTASLLDSEAQAASMPLEVILQSIADRIVRLHRAESYVGTDQVRAKERSVVHLTATDPRWSESRSATLLYDPTYAAFRSC
jgi:energy-coupling factor transporter ATP-binding protein EcfA2